MIELLNKARIQATKEASLTPHEKITEIANRMNIELTKETE